jgi:xylulokinase
MSPSVLMGIDLGTSSTKTVLIDASGRLLAVASREYPVDTPCPGWAEQDPEQWLAAATETMAEAMARAQTAPEEVAAIGLSGQMHGTPG